MLAGLAPLISLREFDSRSAEWQARDDAIYADCRTRAPWGLATAIDLGACDGQLIRDPQQIERFVLALCDEIAMRRFGTPIIVRFGDDPRVSGYSLAQLIETSLVAGHFAEQSNAAYIDIFSCKPYRPYHAARFCATWFGASAARVSVVLRDATAAGLPRSWPL